MEKYIIQNKNIPIRIYRNKVSRPLSAPRIHRHMELEIDWVTSGNGIFIIGETSYNVSEDDIFIISNQEYHHAFNCDHLEVLGVEFQVEKLLLHDNLNGSLLCGGHIMTTKYRQKKGS